MFYLSIDYNNMDIRSTTTQGKANLDTVNTLLAKGCMVDWEYGNIIDVGPTPTPTVTQSPTATISPTATPTATPTITPTTLTWQKMYGGTGDESSYTTWQTSDGGYIAVGYTTSTDIAGCPAIGGIDFYLMKLDPNGIL